MAKRDRGTEDPTFATVGCRGDGVVEGVWLTGDVPPGATHLRVERWGTRFPAPALSSLGVFGLERGVMADGGGGGAALEGLARGAGKVGDGGGGGAVIACGALLGGETGFWFCFMDDDVFGHDAGSPAG